MYLARANERPAEEARNIIRTVGVGIGILVAIAFLAQFKELSRLWVAVFATRFPARTRGPARSQRNARRAAGTVTQFITG